MRPWIFLAGVLAACTAQPPEAEEVVVLRPIQLQADTTTLYLRDFFPTGPLPDSISTPEGLHVKRTTDARLPHDTLVLLWGALQEPRAVLTFHQGTATTEVVLFQSQTKPVVFSFSGSAEDEVQIRGSFNGWNELANPMAFSEGVWKGEFQLEPGSYEYLFKVNGREQTDPAAVDSVSNGMGRFNSLRVVAADSTPVVPLQPQFDVQKGLFQDDLFPDQHWMLLHNNRVLARGRGPYEVPLPAERGHARIRLFTWRNGAAGAEVEMPLLNGMPIADPSLLDEGDFHGLSLYFLMVDRFRNGDQSNDAPLNLPDVLPQADWHGGDLEGLTQTLMEGYFDSLGVTGIWLSPIALNPSTPWGLWDKGGVTTRFSGYHGYWPISGKVIDPHFGDSTALAGLLDVAHRNHKRVLLDYVANHVHTEHHVYKEHPDWATPLYLEDGTLNTERWDTHRLTTWFDKHLATLDLSRWEVTDPMADSALFWLQTFPFDGFRHDATKHIDELYWRTLTHRIRENIHRPIYQIGETYGSPGLINSYLGNGLLDAQFDFNLYDASIGALAKEGDFKNLRRVLEQSLNTYGAHHLMGNISGNQDRPRFVSLASGEVGFDEDTKLAGWTRQINRLDSNAAQRMLMLQALNACLPGVPCIYYGDEIGMPGGNDPDNRRDMVFDNLSPLQKAMKAKTGALFSFRSTSMALVYGTTAVSEPLPGVLVVKRTYLNETVYLVLNNTSKPVLLHQLGIPANATPALQGLIPSREQVEPTQFLILTS